MLLPGRIGTSTPAAGATVLNAEVFQTRRTDRPRKYATAAERYVARLASNLRAYYRHRPARLAYQRDYYARNRGTINALKRLQTAAAKAEAAAQLQALARESQPALPFTLRCSACGDAFQAESEERRCWRCVYWAEVGQRLTPSVGMGIP